MVWRSVFKIMFGDNFELFEFIKDGSVDLIYIDLFFNIGK